MNVINKFNVKQSSKSRTKDKLRSVVDWLAKFDFSTRDLIGMMLNVNYQGQGAFFQKLEKSNIIFRHKLIGTSKNIYSLTTDGNQLASLYSPDVIVKEHRKSPSLVAINHAFCIQYIVAEYLRKYADAKYQTEKQYMHLHLQRRPDAIIEIDGKKIAIEIEITKKALPKIYYNYLCHIKNIRKCIYNEVIYYFNNQTILDYYQSLYDYPRWMIYHKSSTGGRMVKSDKHFISDEIKQYNFIKFNYDPMYIL